MYESGFTDFGAKFEFGTLPDGRYFYLGNLSPQRAELVLMTSEDGVNFDTRYEIATEEIPRKYEGLYKGGIYGYPHAIEVDGVITAITSINKEDIRVFRFAVSDLV